MRTEREVEAWAYRFVAVAAIAVSILGVATGRLQAGGALAVSTGAVFLAFVKIVGGAD